MNLDISIYLYIYICTCVYIYSDGGQVNIIIELVSCKHYLSVKTAKNAGNLEEIQYIRINVEDTGIGLSTVAREVYE
jgi:hypothetical protein